MLAREDTARIADFVQGTPIVVPNEQSYDAPTDSGDEPSRCAGFVRLLFAALEDHQVRYCVLHSWDNLPERVETDIDIAVHREDRSKLRNVFASLRSQGYPVVQCLNYAVNAYYFVFNWLNGEQVASVAVDVVFEHRRGGLVVPEGKELTEGRRSFRDLRIPAPEVEFAYLLAKKAWKGKVPARQSERLATLAHQLGPDVTNRIVGEIFVPWQRTSIAAGCRNGAVHEVFQRLRPSTWFASALRAPLKFAKYVCDEAVRLCRRILHPAGAFVIVLGADGAGKTTLIASISSMFESAFRKIDVFHWRPELIRRGGEHRVINNPYRKPPHGQLLSILSLFAYFTDFALGYWIRVKPSLIHAGLVIFDRYFPDMLVDPKRYRFAGPHWLAALMGRLLVPRNAIVLVLDAPEEVMLLRKNEVSLDQLRDRRAGYGELARRLKHAHLISTGQMFEATRRKTYDILVQHMTEQLRHLYPEWFEPNLA